MVKFILAALFTTTIATAHAGFDEGMSAYKVGKFSLAVKEFSSEQNNAKAQFYLGFIYSQGLGERQDFEQALHWYRKAAGQGYAPAQNLLGDMYHEGLGVQKDYAQAVIWYRKAAEQGFVLAQINLGTMYSEGIGVPKDYVQAVSWYKKAAEHELQQGWVETWSFLSPEDALSRAQTNLGMMYERGRGVQQDLVIAYALYTRAAALDPSSFGIKTRRDAVISNMTPKQIEAGQRLTNEIANPKNTNKAIATYSKNPK